MNKKLLPIIIIVVSLFVFFGNDLGLDKIFNKNSVEKTEVEKEVDKDLMKEMSEVIDVIKKSKASSETKLLASALWIGAGDMWAISDVDINSNKMVDFNKDLLSIYGKRYPELSNSFPGFSDAINKVFSKLIGEYPKQLTKEDCKKISNLYYAVGLSFQK